MVSFSIIENFGFSYTIGDALIRSCYRYEMACYAWFLGKTGFVWSFLTSSRTSNEAMQWPYPTNYTKKRFSSFLEHWIHISKGKRNGMILSSPLYFNGNKTSMGMAQLW